MSRTNVRSDIEIQPSDQFRSENEAATTDASARLSALRDADHLVRLSE
jgi:hypothetical protein